MCKKGSKEIKKGANKIKNKKEYDLLKVKNEKIVINKNPNISMLQNIE